MSGAKYPLQTELQFTLDRGEIHVMTGLNKDKDKDKRSGEARVSDVFDCIFILLHIANIFDGSSLANVSDWWYYYCFVQTR